MMGANGLQAVWRQYKRSSGKAPRHKPDLKMTLLTEPFMRLLERLKLYESLQLQLGGYHMKLLILNGADWTMEQTKATAASGVSIGYTALTGCAWLGALAKEPVLLAMGVVFGFVLPIRQFVDAGRKVERRKQEIVAELPDMLSKLMLLVGAGETVQHALAKCLEGKNVKTHPLYAEWGNTVAALRNGHSFSSAVERFNRRCSVQEVSVFTTVLLLNYRRGGEHFMLALRELSYSLWEKRKAVARSRGEEASSKLVFPLVGILLVLMVLVAAPAVLLMS